MLNDKQIEAVRYISGPLLVLAGAGTGKTSVVVSKISYIIQQNIASSENVLAVTFTNKAASEMKQRISKNINFIPNWIGTFHSIAAKILRTHHAQVNLSSNFTILDYEEQLKVVKQVYEDLKLDKNDLNPKVALSIIQSWKDQALSPEDLANSDIRTEAHTLSKRIYFYYQNWIRKMDAVDFGDLILLNIILFKQNPEILSLYQKKFRFIFVDEYQDTNSSQYIWLRMISMQSIICCVGDDDQSIYGWRGAKIENILKFEQDFPNSKIIKLEQNYRSNKDILDAASKLISKNKSRYGKTLWTSNQSSNKIIIKSFWNDKEEAEFIASQIYKANTSENFLYNETAILVRASFQTRIIEEALISASIPYKIIGGMKFYERQEIRDALAYLKLIFKPKDDLSFERIINKPKRGVGPSSVEKIRSHSITNNISLLDSTISMLNSKSFSGKVEKSLNEFICNYNFWQNQHPLQSLPETLDMLLNTSGYLDMLKAEKTPESESRIENLAEFKLALSEYSTLQDFLEHVSLITDIEDIDTNNTVNVMTLHAAKGLEFKTVFLPGWEEGVFPHSKAIEESGIFGLEEERRLAYVGITRAKQNLYILYSSSRRMYNQFVNSIPSRFIEELSDTNLYKAESLKETQNLFSANSIKNNSLHTSSNIVSHPKFGTGYVLNNYGDVLEIKFEDFGVKKILKKYVSFQ